MKISWKKLILCILLPLFVGGISAFLTKDNMDIFSFLNKPSLTPPGFVFPIVWTILYILMGIASYLVLTTDKTDDFSLFFYGLQLFFNFFWSILFFNLEAYLLSFIWLILLWILIFITTILFYKISKPAGYLMIPYLLWVSFAGYLNLAIYFLN